jgi:hypothetical protein
VRTTVSSSTTTSRFGNPLLRCWERRGSIVVGGVGDGAAALAAVELTAA